MRVTYHRNVNLCGPDIGRHFHVNYRDLCQHGLPQPFIVAAAGHRTPVTKGNVRVSKTSERRERGRGRGRERERERERREKYCA
jgi:hypothetical protein